VELKLYDHLAPGSALGWVAAGLTRRTRALKRYVKHHPRLWPRVVKLRAMVGRLRALPAERG
jgi:hypothetical protein